MIQERLFSEMISGFGRKVWLGVVPANQTEESEVRELSGKESGTGSGTPFLREFV